MIVKTGQPKHKRMTGQPRPDKKTVTVKPRWESHDGTAVKVPTDIYDKTVIAIQSGQDS
jgi:hypothetical protein